MAVIRLDTWGGVRPSCDPLNLPASELQRSANLLASVGDFRPLGADQTVVSDSGVNNPKTLYRLARAAGGALDRDMTLNWRVHAERRHYVKGQINDDKTERTCYTLPGQPPRVTDNTGVDRRLGIPRPSVAPSINVIENYQYTQDEKDKDVNGATTDIRAAIKASMSDGYVGPDTGVSGVDNGFLRAGSDAALSARTYVVQDGKVTDSFTSLPPDRFGWVFDAGLEGYLNNGRWVIPYYGRAKTIIVNEAVLRSKLAAIKRTTATDDAKLLSTAAVDAIAARVMDAFKTGAAAKALIDAHVVARNNTEALLGMSSDAANFAALQAFYSSAATQAQVNTILQNFAADVFDRVRTMLLGGNGGFA